MPCFNLLFIHHGAGHGGVQNNLARFWAAMDRDTFSPRLAYEEEGLLSARARELAIPHVRLRLPAWRKFLPRLRMRAAVRALCAYSRLHRVRLVVANDFWYAPHAVLTAERLGVPSLIYVRLSDLLDARKIRQYLLPRAGGLLVPSRAYAAPLLALPETAEQTRVVPNGIDIEHFHPDVPLPPAPLPWKRDAGLVVGNTGTLSEVKGQETLLAAAELLRQRGRPLRVLLLGGGKPEYLRTLRERHRGLFDSGVVHLEAGAGDVRPWLRAMDVFAMTSHRESFGLALAEAMAMGIPAVYADTGGPAEIAAEAGLPFPPGDAPALAARLEWLIEHPQERAHLSVLARQRIAERFTLAAQVENTERFYQDLLSRWPSRS